tara:strand:+ start:744 stop:893 length:150 start_codon:yes stop_codon:yes gene_type:complete
MRKLFKITLFTILLISSILGGGIVTMRLEKLKEHNTLLKRKEIIKNILK